MAKHIQRILIAFAAVITVTATAAWLTGRASSETVTVLAIGFLVLSAFYFVLAMLLRLPFQRLRSALASLMAVVLVLIGLLYALPLIEAYRMGDDVSRSLFNPLVFESLGFGILALTHRK